MNYLFNLFWGIFVLFAASCSPEKKMKVLSPDGNIEICVNISNGNLFYNINNQQVPILNKSQMGFVLKNDSLCNNLSILDVRYSSFDEEWEQLWGEEKTIRNRYNQMSIDVVEKTGLKRKFTVVFRAFDDGIGFRYEFPEQNGLKNFVIMDELTEFALAKDCKVWSIPAETPYYEALYSESIVSRLNRVSTPLTMEREDGLYLSIHEANLTDYAAMNLKAINNTTTLKVDLTPWSTGEKVFMKSPNVTPWRTIIIASKPGDLLLSRLMLNLNEPCKIEDPSWIKTGRYIGIWWGMHLGKYTWEAGPNHGATTENTKKYIDFASKHNYSGVLVEGWNKGWEYNGTENGSEFSFTEAYPDFNLMEVSEYATMKNVGLIGHHETRGATINYENQMDSAFALCRKYNINVVKTGYVGTLLDGKELNNSQYGVRHYRKVIETAAKYHIAVDVHEPIMPTGLQRTYPNLMTQEGVRGQEWDAWSADGGNPPNHTTIIPFTRGVAGPIDFTPGIFSFSYERVKNTRVQTTLAKQLALSVIIYSPLQMSSDIIENYEHNPALEFISSCPTNWFRTVVVNAKIGEYITIARKDRDSESWYVGSITNADKRKLILPLEFLDDNTTYLAKIFKDGEDADYKLNPDSINIEEIIVNSKMAIELNLARSGGTAIILKKIK